MSVMQLTAIVATAYHAVIKGVPELNWNYTQTWGNMKYSFLFSRIGRDVHEAGMGEIGNRSKF
jgi:hypothetical protein